MNLRIGIDFDNTIVRYDSAFYSCAVERGWVSTSTPPEKRAIRERIRSLPGGNDLWTELQGHVYGLRMDEASLADGVVDFVRACRREGIPVFIVSHKTEFPLLGPRANLRDSAMKWMEKNAFFSGEGLGLCREVVHFESTREGKLKRIVELNCSHFVDDLEEVFLDPEFPPGVEKLLYVPDRCGEFPGGIMAFDSWRDIARHIQHCCEGR
jgi:hypothetical protein